MYWTDKNVFVTGATGLLGSWLVKALVDSNANVVCLIRDIVPKSNLYLNGYYKKGGYGKWLLRRLFFNRKDFE